MEREAPRPAWLTPEKIIACLDQCGNPHCTFINKAQIEARNTDAVACHAEQQLEDSGDDYQREYDTFKSIRRIISHCPFEKDILSEYQITPREDI